MTENPTLFAVIPANVRYDTTLRANEKLLYGEITALTHSTGECWASNTYFSKLYGVTNQAVSRWILNLQKRGYITVDYLYRDGTKEIEKRVIRLTANVSTNVYEVSTNVSGGINKCLGGYQQNVKENNTSMNNTSMNKNIYGRFQNVLLTESEYEKVKAEGLTPLIEELSMYIASSGKKYKSHYATILSWNRRRKEKTTGKLQRKQGFDIEEIKRRAELNEDFDI